MPVQLDSALTFYRINSSWFAAHLGPRQVGELWREGQGWHFTLQHGARGGPFDAYRNAKQELCASFRVHGDDTEESRRFHVQPSAGIQPGQIYRDTCDGRRNAGALGTQRTVRVLRREPDGRWLCETLTGYAGEPVQGRKTRLKAQTIATRYELVA